MIKRLQDIRCRKYCCCTHVLNEVFVCNETEFRSKTSNTSLPSCCTCNSCKPLNILSRFVISEYYTVYTSSAAPARWILISHQTIFSIFSTSKALGLTGMTSTCLEIANARFATKSYVAMNGNWWPHTFFALVLSIAHVGINAWVAALRVHSAELKYHGPTTNWCVMWCLLNTTIGTRRSR